MPRVAIYQRILLLAACNVLVAASASCQTGGGASSTVTGADLIDMTTKMSENLRACEFFKNRDGTSPRAIIVTNKVENLSSDIFSDPEEWLLVAKVQNSMPLTELSDQKNVRFEIPPERAELIQKTGYAGHVASGSNATHAMNAVIRSGTRVRSQDGGALIDERLDYYTIEYTLTDLKTRELVWSHLYEFKRMASGVLID